MRMETRMFRVTGLAFAAVILTSTWAGGQVALPTEQVEAVCDYCQSFDDATINVTVPRTAYVVGVGYPDNAPTVQAGAECLRTAKPPEERCRQVAGGTR